VKFDNEILQRHLVSATIDQLVREYRDKGYDVVPSEPELNGAVDLVVQRGNRKIYFYLKSGPFSAERRESFRAVHEHVRSLPEGQFLAVLVNPPDPPAIQVDGIAPVLQRVCQERIACFGDEVYDARVSAVTQVGYKDVEVTRDGIELRGDAVACFRWDDSWGDESDPAESIPFTFDLVLDHELEVKEVRWFGADARLPERAAR
jgi:hypothetical protein